MMETYLRRTYGQRKSEDLQDFPFWDYRSRRGMFSCSNSSFSGSSSSCDGSSISSISSSRSETGSENTSISDNSDTDSLMVPEQQKMFLQFMTDTNEISAMEALYQPILNWIDPDLHLLKVTDCTECHENRSSMPNTGTQLPSMAVMVFLHEEGMVGFERIQSVKRNFEKAPWKFHHSEQVQRGTINPYPYNSQDFYYTSENLPLWAVRQVHYGKEHIRTVLFVSEGNWDSMVQFYKLLVGSEPDTKREDFCLFTVHSHIHFDIQLALKKLQSDTKPRVLENVKIQFRVNDISSIMPMFPNVCRPLSDNRWETTDSDGNVVVIEIPGLGTSSISERSSLSDTSSISGRNPSIRMGSLSYKRSRLGSSLLRRSQRLKLDEGNTQNNIQNENVTMREDRGARKINLKQYLIQPTLQLNKENKLPKLPKTTAKVKVPTQKSRQDNSYSFRSKSPVDEKLQAIKQNNMEFQAKIEEIAKELHKRLASLSQNETDINQNKTDKASVIDINQNKIDKANVHSEEVERISLKGFYV